jgi:hypothetical protein
MPVHCPAVRDRRQSTQLADESSRALPAAACFGLAIRRRSPENRVHFQEWNARSPSPRTAMPRRSLRCGSPAPRDQPASAESGSPSAKPT